MPRTFIRQETQIRNSDTYDDTLAAGATLESSAASIEDDLNALRSQVNRIIDDSGTGNWYDAIPTVNAKQRSLLDLNTDLDDIEEKRLLFRSQILTDVTVTGGQNFEILSVAGSEAPSETAAVGAVITQGAVVAQNGTFGSHSLAEVAGPNAIRPDNLCIVRDATTGEPIISSNGKQIYALLQSESATDGHTFNDGAQRVQLSFVEENASGDDLVATAIADIAGSTINYAYVRRIAFDSIPEDAFLAGVFLDQAASTDVTLDNAIDNQTGPATQNQNIEVRITDTFSWAFQDSTGAADILSIDAAVAGDSVSMTVADFTVTNTNTATMTNGLAVDTGGTQINLGATAGQIDSVGALTLASAAASDLTIDAANEIVFDDGNKTASTFAGALKLTETTAEWDTYETNFGEVSIFNALNQLASSAGLSRTKGVALVTAATIAADTDVGATTSGNIDVDLPDYSGVGSFVTDVDVYLNGTLLRNGANAAANHDVYPGTTAANGDLRFEFALTLDDQITMIVWV